MLVLKGPFHVTWKIKARLDLDQDPDSVYKLINYTRFFLLTDKGSQEKSID
jgi:hypothetical protein